MAMPWPPPTHIDSTPNSLSASSRPLINVVMMRAPVIPNGWPNAMAPPLTLSFSQGILSASADGTTCAANASLISKRSMSPMVRRDRPTLDRLSACLIASIGPRPIVRVDDGAVVLLVGRDLTLDEAAVDGFLGAVLRQTRELVLAFAADLLVLGHVLGGLAHCDVDVGQTLRRLPAATLARRAVGAAFFGLGKPFVVRPAVGGTIAKAAHCFDAARDEHVALAGAHRV